MHVFTGVRVKPEEVGSVITPILQKGKLRLKELKKVAQDHRAKKWARKTVLTLLTSSACFPLERAPNVADSALDYSKAIISKRMPRNPSSPLCSLTSET